MQGHNEIRLYWTISDQVHTLHYRTNYTTLLKYTQKSNTLDTFNMLFYRNCPIFTFHECTTLRLLGYYTIPLTCTMLRYYPRYIYSTSPLRTTIIHNTDNTVLYIHYKSSHNYNFMEVLIIMIQHKLAVFMRSC